MKQTYAADIPADASTLTPWYVKADPDGDDWQTGVNILVSVRNTGEANVQIELVTPITFHGLNVENMYVTVMAGSSIVMRLNPPLLANPDRGNMARVYFSDPSMIEFTLMRAPL